MITYLRRVLGSAQESYCISHYLKQVSDLLSLQTFKTPSPLQLMNSSHYSLRKEQQSDGNSFNFPPPTLLTYLHLHSHSLPSSYYNGKKNFPVPKNVNSSPYFLDFISSSHVQEIQACNCPVTLHVSLVSLCLLDHSNKHKHTNYPLGKNPPFISCYLSIITSFF